MSNRHRRRPPRTSERAENGEPQGVDEYNGLGG